MRSIAFDSTFFANGLSLNKPFTHIAEHYGFNIVLYSEIDQIKSDKNQAVVTGRVDEFDDKLFDNLVRLRLDLGFRGPIFVITFVPREKVAKREEMHILDSQAVFYFQLPFCVEYFVKELMCGANLSDEEMKQVNKELGVVRISQLAREIGHNHVNSLFLSLAHFGEIEKLSYYRSPALVKIIEHVQAIKFYLTREKMHDFRADLTHLLNCLRRWQVAEHSELSLAFEEYWKVIEEWFSLSESFPTDGEVDLPVLFGSAIATKTALRNIFALIQSSKEASEEL